MVLSAAGIPSGPGPGIHFDEVCRSVLTQLL